jgi:hypothetical protein
MKERGIYAIARNNLQWGGLDRQWLAAHAVDVVNENGPADTIPNELMFCCANERLVGPMDSRSCEIESLRASFV